MTDAQILHGLQGIYERVVRFDLGNPNLPALKEVIKNLTAALAATPAVGGDAVAEALKPFVDALDSIDKDTPPNQRCGDDECIGDALWNSDQPTVGDLRKLVSARPMSPLRGIDYADDLEFLDLEHLDGTAAAIKTEQLDKLQFGRSLHNRPAAPPEQPAAATVMCVCCEEVPVKNERLRLAHIIQTQWPLYLSAADRMKIVTILCDAQPEYLSGCQLRGPGECQSRGMCQSMSCKHAGKIIVKRVCVEAREDGIVYPKVET